MSVNLATRTTQFQYLLLIFGIRFFFAFLFDLADKVLEMQLYTTTADNCWLINPMFDRHICLKQLRGNVGAVLVAVLI